MNEDYEEMLRSKIEVLKDRLREAECILEEVQEKIDCREDKYNYRWHMNEVNTENYQKEIIEIEKLIPKLRKQYKKLSIEDIKNTYSKDINDLKNKIEELTSKKQLLEPQISLIEDEIQQQRVLEESIKNNTEIMKNAMQTMQIDNSEIEKQVNDIADFWTIIMDGDASKRGIMKVKAKFYTKSKPGDLGWYPFCELDSFKEEYIEIYVTRLEYELFKICAKNNRSPDLFKNSGAWNKDWDNWEGVEIRTELGEFVDYDKLSLEQKNKISKQKQKKEKRIKKMQEKARKHPQIYDRLGSLLGIEISQSELIKHGVDPDAWGWKEIERAEVDSGDIARASKEKGVRKSLISRIAGIFSRKKEDKDR